MNKLPFSNNIKIVMPSNLLGLPPEEINQIQSWTRLFKEHRRSLSRELGADFEFSETDPGVGERWLVGPRKSNKYIAGYSISEPNGPLIFLDRENRVLITDGKSPQDVIETLSYIRSLSRFEGGEMLISDCTSTLEAANRIANEVRYSLSSMKMKGINWDSLCEKYIPLAQKSSDPIPVFQQWLAELNDGHTWVRPVPPLGELPYKVWSNGKVAVFQEVNDNSPAWEAGVRPGYILTKQDLESWWKRTASTLHSKPLLVGRRLLSGELETVVKFEAESLTGEKIKWKDKFLKNPWEPLVEYKELDSGIGYIKIRAWIISSDFDEKIDAAFEAFEESKFLIVDLRGNPGGNLMLAHSFRNRFLKSKRQVGWIQQTCPDGSLSELEPIIGEPNLKNKRWEKRVCFLTDPLTYSASEDALLGLQGQENVKVVGEPSGGGSGRLRLIRLLPGWMLTITTALTYDMFGNCIEGSGIPVDHLVEVDRLNPGEDTVLKVAEILK